MRENGRAGGTAEAQGPGGLEKSMDCAGAAGRRRAGRWGGEGRQLGFGKSQTKSLGWGRGQTRRSQEFHHKAGKALFGNFFIEFGGKEKTVETATRMGWWGQGGKCFRVRTVEHVCM